MFKVKSGRESMLKLIVKGEATFTINTRYNSYDLHVNLVENKPYFRWSYDEPREAQAIEQWMRQKIYLYTDQNPVDIYDWKDNVWGV